MCPQKKKDNKMKTAIWILALGLGLSVARPAPAAWMVYEGFDIPPGNRALSGGAGATSKGWTNHWTTNMPNQVVVPGLRYKNSRTLRTVEGAAQLAVAGGGSFRGFAPAYTTATGTYWVSFLGRVPSNSTYCGLSLCNPYNEMLFIGDLTGSEDKWGAQAFSLTGGVSAVSSFASDRPAFIVVRVDFNAASILDNVRIWMNPALGPIPPNDQEATLSFLGEDLRGAAEAKRFDRIRLQQGADGTNGIFDEIRIGTTWATVAPFVEGGN
jgi:hypothetical protein